MRARSQPGLRFDRRAERGQLGLIALGQLGLELDEPLDDAATLDDIDLVEAQLDTRRGRPQLALAAELADRDALDERRVAGVLDDERPGIGCRPVDRRGDAIRRPLELFAMHGAVRPFGVGQRLDGHDRLAAALAEADRETGTRQGAVGGVDIAVLELRGPCAAGAAAERAQPVGRQQSFGGGQVSDAVLELDLRHARGSREPAPEPGRRGTDADVTRHRAPVP